VGQPVVYRILDRISRRRADTLTQFVVEELELVLDFRLGPAADLAADAPAVGAES
jgi:hypothetical protein